MTTKQSRVPFALLFFAQAHTTGLWMVTFSNVLKAHGLERTIPYAFSCSALAAFISPLIAGSLADQHISPVRLLRWVALGTALFLALAFTAIERNWGAAWLLIFFQIQFLFSMPTWGLATSIVLRVLENPTSEFGPIRVWATFGWIAAGFVNSYVLHADLSPRAGMAAAAVWLIVAALTFLLPKVEPTAETSHRSWRELLGVEALMLLRHRDHSVVFITAALVSIPLAAFYPFASMQLHELGEERVASTMALGQVTEIIAMYALAPLLARFRMKWVLLAGIAFGIVRYGLFTMNTKAAVLAGITLHGLCFTLFYIPAQMYLDRRIDRRLHARAQALLTLMVSGVGTLGGYLGCGWWREACLTETGTDWPIFWAVLTAFLAAVLIYFMVAYRGARAASPPVASEC
jgi:nucleoside transporter